MSEFAVSEGRRGQGRDNARKCGESRELKGESLPLGESEFAGSYLSIANSLEGREREGNTKRIRDTKLERIAKIRYC